MARSRGTRSASRSCSITPTRATGWTNAVLAANVVDPEVARTLPAKERATWLIDRERWTVRLDNAPQGLEGLILPLQPMIGCFGVAPGLGQALSNATSAEHGGNMDYRGFGPGATAWFPIEVSGALFYLGTATRFKGTAKSSAQELKQPSRSSYASAWRRDGNLPGRVARRGLIFSLSATRVRWTRRCSTPLRTC